MPKLSQAWKLSLFLVNSIDLSSWTRNKFVNNLSSTTLTLYTFSKLCPFFKTLFMGMWLRAWCDMLEADEISKRKPNMGRQLLPLRFWGGDWQIGYIACIIASSLYSSFITIGSKILWSCTLIWNWQKISGLQNTQINK